MYFQTRKVHVGPVYTERQCQCCDFLAKPLLGPVYTKRQRQSCNDACDSFLTENSGVAPDWVCNPFSSDTIVFNENRIARVIAELTLTLGINRPLLNCSDFLINRLSYLTNELQPHLITSEVILNTHCRQ